MTDERRRSRRYSAMPGQDEATISCRRQAVSARVVDLSAGGFRISVESDPKCEVGDVVQLKTTGGRFEVRITNIERRDDAPMILGLQRISELPLAPAERMATLRQPHA